MKTTILIILSILSLNCFALADDDRISNSGSGAYVNSSSGPRFPDFQVPNYSANYSNMRSSMANREIKLPTMKQPELYKPPAASSYQYNYQKSNFEALQQSASRQNYIDKLNQMNSQALKLDSPLQDDALPLQNGALMAMPFDAQILTTQEGAIPFSPQSANSEIPLQTNAFSAIPFDAQMFTTQDTASDSPAISSEPGN